MSFTVTDTVSSVERLPSDTRKRKVSTVVP